MQTRDSHASARAIACDECLRPIRWWHRRVAADGERWAHLRCWKSQLLFKEIVADQIRYAQHAAEEIRLTQLAAGKARHAEPATRDTQISPIILSEPVENQPNSHKVPQRQSSQVDGVRAKVPPADNGARAPIELNQRHSEPTLDELGELWQFLYRGSLLFNFDKQRQVASVARPPLRLCLRCGAAALRATSMFCTKCGGPISEAEAAPGRSG